MPVWLRKFYIKLIVQFKQEEEKAIKGGQKNSSKRVVHRPNISR